MIAVALPALDAECAALHRQVFGADLPAGFAEAYTQAHAVVFDAAPIDARSAAFIAQAVDGAWDLEALEMAWRARDKANPLSKKLNIVFYLVECSPRGYQLFVNPQDARLQGWFQLGTLTLRSLYKRLRGTLLLRRLERSHA